MADPIKYFNGTMRFKKDGEALVSGMDNEIFYRLRINIIGKQFVDGEITDFHVVIRNLAASKRFEDKLDLYKIAKHETYNRQVAWFHNEKNPSVELKLTAESDLPAPYVEGFKLTGDVISALGVDLESLSSDIEFFVTIEQYLTPLEKLGKNYADEDAADTTAPIAGSLGGSGNIADTVVEYDKNLVDRFAKKVVLCHIDPPFKEGEEERTESYKALKNFIESEANDQRRNSPVSEIFYEAGLPMTQVVKYLWQLSANFSQLSSSEKAAYMAFCETMVPRYGVIFEMTDGRKFDIPPVYYRSEDESSYRPNPSVKVELINEASSETEFRGEIVIMFTGGVVMFNDRYDVIVDFYYTCVFDGSKWKLDEDRSGYLPHGLEDLIKSIDIYVIQ